MINDKNIEIFINNKYNELLTPNLIGHISKYLPYYKEVENQQLQYLFAYFHYQFNVLFKFMNQKLYNRHYNASESRELLKLIQDEEEIIDALQNYKNQYKLINTYAEIIQICKDFLSTSGGSHIPEDFEQIKTIEIGSIFQSKISISCRGNNFKLKLVGEGSYAHVYKFKDEYYDTIFAVKKAKASLDAQELERFRREFESMKKLNSPYILRVYSFNADDNSYIMEYADATLFDYITKNNTKLSINKRIGFIKQIFKAFEYINDSIGLHRDISAKNILIQRYDGDIDVIKISDFGLIKLKESELTSINTEFKGSLNDPKLNIVGGFKNYDGHHETYALTRLVYFVMTGKIIIDKSFINEDFKHFIEIGISDDTSLRYQSVEEMKNKFNLIKF